MNNMVNDLAKGKPIPRLIKQKLPHIMPHRERVLMFRNDVNTEKAGLGILDNESHSPQSTLITVHRLVSAVVTVHFLLSSVHCILAVLSYDITNGYTSQQM